MTPEERADKTLEVLRATGWLLPEDEKGRCSTNSNVLRAQMAATIRDATMEMQKELDAIRHAAHMPDDYEHGLPSWINQHLYGRLMAWTDVDGRPIRRSEDIEELIRLQEENARLRQWVAELESVPY